MMLARCLLLLALLVPAGTWAGDCPPEPRLPEVGKQALHEAYQYLDQKQPVRATERLQALARRRPDLQHHQLSFTQAMLAYERRDLASAQKLLRQAVELYPCFGLAWRNLAVVLYEQKKPLAAAASAVKAYHLSHPPDPELLHQAAVFYLEAQKPREALGLLEELCGTPPAPNSWLQALVQAQVALEQWPQAATLARRLRDREPANAAWWRLTAGIAARRKEYRRAAADLEVAYRLAPPGAAACRELAEVYRAAGLPQKAAAWYERGLGQDPQPRQWETLARIHGQAGQWDLAMAAARKALAQATSSRWGLLAELSRQKRAYAEAAVQYAEAATKGQAARYYRLAGQCAWQGGDLPGAEGYFEKSLGAAAPGSQLRAQVTQTLADLREQRRSLAELKSGAITSE
ncbi:MAG: tetratricopeptide repeat protein [Deltaproteobacteria bacterium]|nr:tetratricopeptide repeat protein [Deltaproteobacteria bacterium]